MADCSGPGGLPRWVCRPLSVAVGLSRRTHTECTAVAGCRRRDRQRRCLWLAAESHSIRYDRSPPGEFGEPRWRATNAGPDTEASMKTDERAVSGRPTRIAA